MIASNLVKIVPNTVQRLTMSDEEYFGNGLPDYISNSRLGLINPAQGGSARKYSFGFEDEAKYSAALELGSAVHALILEADSYNLAEVSKPTGMVGPIFDSVYKMMNRGDEESMDFESALNTAVQYHNYYGGKVEGKRRETLINAGKPYLDFLQKYKAPGMICLTEDMRLKLLSCVQSVKANKAAQALLEPTSDEFFRVDSFNEDVIICDVELDFDGSPYKVALKAKIDNWSIDFANKVVTLNDLKTTGKGIQDFPGRTEFDYVKVGGVLENISTFVKGSFQTYHYHRQMFMYAWMLWQYVTEHHGVDDSWTLNINMIVVETNKPHNCQVFGVGLSWIELGKEEFDNLLHRVVWHRKNGFDKLMEFDRNNVFVIE